MAYSTGRRNEDCYTCSNTSSELRGKRSEGVDSVVSDTGGCGVRVGVSSNTNSDDEDSDEDRDEALNSQLLPMFKKSGQDLRPMSTNRSGGI